LISLTHGLNCIVCSSATDVNCVDPSHADASVLNGYTRPGFVSCIVSNYTSIFFIRIFCHVYYYIRKQNIGEVMVHMLIKL